MIIKKKNNVKLVSDIGNNERERSAKPARQLCCPEMHIRNAFHDIKNIIFFNKVTLLYILVYTVQSAHEISLVICHVCGRCVSCDSLPSSVV
jgi:hypothetical protein